MQSTPNKLEIALAYIELGWAVFPLAPNTKVPFKDSAGFKDASKDPKVIKKWWMDNPNANIGIATGKISRLFVVDLDDGDAGVAAWVELCRQNGSTLIETRTARTVSGSRHLLFKYPAGEVKLRNSEKEVPHIDTRGDGGYIVAAPSYVEDYKHTPPRKGFYSWVDESVPIVEMPPWLVALYRKQPDPVAMSKPTTTLVLSDEKKTSIARILLDKYINSADIGNRNGNGFQLALQLRDNGFPKADAQSILEEYMARVPQDGVRYTLTEAINSVNSAYNSTPRDPSFKDLTPLHSTTLISHNSLISQPLTAPWPPCLAPEAFHGLAGQIVKTLEPHTEADPAAILTNLLVAAGALFGDKPHFKIGGDDHPPRLFGVIVGKTSKARKGTSWGIIKRFLAPTIEEFTKLTVSGLSSGEGLIWAVRDPIIKQEPIKKNGRVAGYQDVQTDPGVVDKRLLVVETEFARTLKVMGREANILSSVIRQAWDDGDLRVMTKTSPAVATAAHITILGHITIEELLRNLDSTESANGFANRFVWMAVKRSKCLASGGQLADENLVPLQQKFKAVVEYSSQVGEMGWDETAKKIWAKIYPSLSEGYPGFFGSMIGRAETQVIRLSLIYALLDSCPSVKPEHLFAALAFWDRVESSVRHIFGEKTGYPLADAILRLIRNTDGITQADISKSFGKHQSAEMLEKALVFLQEAGQIQSERQETEGRTATMWRPRCEISELSEIRGTKGYLELAKTALKELELKSPPQPQPSITDYPNPIRPEATSVQSPLNNVPPDLLKGVI